MGSECGGDRRAAREDVAERPDLHVRAGETDVPVLRAWKTGFAVAAGEAARLPGLVDLYEGPRHLSTALIVAAGERAGERCFEFKRRTPAVDAAPVDFVREERAARRWPRFIAGRRRPPADAPPPPRPAPAAWRG